MTEERRPALGAGLCPQNFGLALLCNALCFFDLHRRFPLLRYAYIARLVGFAYVCQSSDASVF